MKIKRIEHISYNLDGKRFIEGKIKLDLYSDLEQAQAENIELDKWIYAHYNINNEYDLEQAMFETLVI